jgi:hypothetical protein
MIRWIARIGVRLTEDTAICILSKVEKYFDPEERKKRKKSIFDFTLADDHIHKDNDVI